MGRSGAHLGAGFLSAGLPQLPVYAPQYSTHKRRCLGVRSAGDESVRTGPCLSKAVAPSYRPRSAARSRAHGVNAAGPAASRRTGPESSIMFAARYCTASTSASKGWSATATACDRFRAQPGRARNRNVAPGAGMEHLRERGAGATWMRAAHCRGSKNRPLLHVNEPTSTRWVPSSCFPASLTTKDTCTHYDCVGSLEKRDGSPSCSAGGGTTSS